MSNRPTIQNTKFIDLDANGKQIGKPAYGVRIFDDNGQMYSNTMDKKDLPCTPEQALAVIPDLDSNMHDFIVSERLGFYFNDDWCQVDENGHIVVNLLILKEAE